MSNENTDTPKKSETENKSSIQPEPETLHTPDPPKEMEGPVSSIMQKIKEGFNPEESKEEADRKRDESL